MIIRESGLLFLGHPVYIKHNELRT